MVLKKYLSLIKEMDILNNNITDQSNDAKKEFDEDHFITIS